MGREVRKVPVDWKHPKNSGGHYVPLFGESYQEEVERVIPEWREFVVGCDKDGIHRGHECDFEEWDGGFPDPANHMFYVMPPDEELTHIQMYETCTEGTPISPVMEKPEELAQWLADNDASSFGSMTATYEQWLRMIKGS